MITVIRNDHQARFAHDCYGFKIKEEKPTYKIIGTLNNEGICIYESPNYAEIAITFENILNAIVNGQKYVFIHPPIKDKTMSKEEFDASDIQDFCTFKTYDNEDTDVRKIPAFGYDMYGRPITGYKRDDLPKGFKPTKNEYQDMYDWQHQSEKKGFTNVSPDLKNFDNIYDPMNPHKNYRPL